MQNDSEHDVASIDILYTQTEICTLCHITVSTLGSYIDHGVIDDLPDVESHFQQAHLIRILKAMKLQHELELDIAHLALVIGLLDTIEAQRSELELLRQLIV
ncbi:chaperone modulator CbpM [Granulosicoccus antarcticus]|uniref:Chaperone modulatory protein CbpM n=1 Tax=Granulosicoccus antarcticus IMCC3135 TaxID=1192854 RepID=A0A2Z2NID3_9GAMM|nr:chaperone modulator CbpM [Granulosicoccus antarcticus]ASJ70899.1 Chaperone modulatory protein CbpM [Granulosicoccus antarcticus IMCC3135]